MAKVEPGVYKHFKGKEYEVIGTARDSETLAELVVYRALYDSPEFGPNALWVRPVKEFFDEVEVDGEKIRRFEKINITKVL
ncbi:MAG: DUF1653 domain-containing protein [Patescibacteria group bacterium]